MSANTKKSTAKEPDNDEEVPETTTGQRAEASKAMKNIADDDDAQYTVNTGSSAKGSAPKSNLILESLHSFKEDVVKRKVAAAMKKRDFDKIVVNPEDAQLVADELELTLVQATQFLRKFDGDAKKVLTHFVTSKPCTVNDMIAI
ncbi:hypothetical protein DSO57_1033207 [Entomophthora muscae]|uniref:Uncharacterized protein n=1 Tax=Entomophthora muscae TaxID=34485 RepID=A0ACC2TLW9_9FUNG|nr:hypothetical protein DSO57_1033207 [Entomophthora muscae]